MRFLANSRLALIAIFATFSLFSCNEKEELTSESLSEYMPLAVGKYITYRLDSMVFTNFGRATEIHKYQEKHQVDAQVTDNQGRPSFRVFRYIRDTAGTLPWQPVGSYFVTPLEDQVELIEDNLRFIKLHLPITDGFSWKGNTYLPTHPYGPLYNFSNDIGIEDWDFYYDGGPASFSYRGNNYSNVYTVEEVDESANVPIVLTTSYAYRSRAVEKYAKGIGLVYREYELWDYQPNTGGAGGPYKTGFGVTMWMIDHN
jgi:hypothetical protein